MKPEAARGVGRLVKTSTIILGLVAAAILVWYLRRDHRADATTAPPPTAGSATRGSAASPHPADHVQKLTPAERKQVADRIANARAGRAAISAPARPALPPTTTTPSPKLPPATLDGSDVETFKTTMRSAMHDVIPFLAECFDKHSAKLPSELKVVARLTLTGDPDVGTLIDTNGVTDDKDEPLVQEFDVCLRDALASLQLPPLTEGDQVQVTYPFLFTR